MFSWLRSPRRADADDRTMAAPAPTDDGNERPRYLSHIDGLRALAVVLVLLNHAGVPGFTGGYIGVDVFFVISGFLITGLLLAEVESESRISVLRFYGRRAMRILPVASLVLVSSSVAAAILLPHNRLRGASWDVIAASGFWSNVRFAVEKLAYHDSGTSESFTLHFWSLALEEQFYIVWPVVIGLCFLLANRFGRSTRSVVLAVSAVVAVSSYGLFAYWTGNVEPNAYFLLPARAWELALGALLAAVPLRVLSNVPVALRSGLAVVSLLSVVACGVLFDGSPGDALLTVLPVLATVVLINATGPVVALLSWRPLRRLGRWSYSIYMLHWPALYFSPLAFGRELSLFERLLVLVAVVAASALVFRSIENPVRGNARLRANPQIAIALGVGLIVGSSGVGLGLAHVPGSSSAVTVAGEPVLADLLTAHETLSLPGNVTPTLDEAFDDTPARRLTRCQPELEVETPPAEGCYAGDLSSSKLWAVIGDSHAGQWLDSLDSIAEERNVRLLMLIKSNCPTLNVTVFNPLLNREFTECDKWRENVATRLERERPEVVFISSFGWHKFASVEKSIPEARELVWEETLERFQKFSHPILIGDTPFPSKMVTDCLDKKPGNVRSCTSSRADAGGGVGRPAEITAARRTGVPYISTLDLVCPAERCPVVVGNILVWRDRDHLTATFVRWLHPEFKRLIDESLAFYSL